VNRNKLDESVSAMRGEQVDDEVVRDAAKRVFRNVFDSAYIPERVGRIKGCADFQKLIPAYRDRTLSPARVALLEDHTSHCVECRRALKTAGAGGIATASFEAAGSRKRLRVLPLALAGVLAAGMAIGVTGAFNGLLLGQHAVRATVVSVEGKLYRMNEFGSSLLEAGAVVRNAEELRTAKGSRAIFQLLDGAKVEMAERSDVSVSRSWSGTSVDVERGRVIVQPAVARQNSFVLSAGDLRIPFKNAVLAIDRGTKSSRVAVAQGSATVERRGRTFPLRAGEEFPPAYHLTNVSLQSDFAWSSNSGHYLALLEELSTLQKQLQAIPQPSLRYGSNLAKFLPAGTVIYTAIPNVGGTIAEAKRIFDGRLEESAVLREWWGQQPLARNGEFDRALEQISAISGYLGDEIVLAVPSSGPHQYGAPIFLAEVRRPGLESYLAQNMPKGEKSLTISLDDHRVIASPEASEVQAVSQSLANPALAGFSQTPFYHRISQSYGAGAGYLLAVDMEQMIPKSVSTPKQVPPGFNNAQYLVLEKRNVGSGDAETRASLSFAGGRQGIASWLGAPGPMGSLDFVSPDANLAASMVMKNPLTVVQELVRYAGQADSQTAQHFSDIEAHLGVKLAEDLAAPFGGDATFAIDGPLVPVPTWKLAVEVYDEGHLRQTINTIVEHFNAQADEKTGRLQLIGEEVNSRTVFSLRNSKMPDVAAYYTFVDGYLLAGPNEATLLQAIQNRENGHTLVSSPGFQSQLPADNYTNFSAVVWHNAGKSLTAVADQLKASGGGPLQAGPGRSLAALLTTSGPGLISIYGEPDRIVAATKGDFLGFNLGTLAGIEQGRSIPSLIASRNSRATTDERTF